MKVNKPDTLFFFTGAAAWIPKAVEYATSKGINCHIFAVTRHLEELFDNTDETFQEVLRKNNISFSHCDDINSSQELLSLVTSNSIAIGLGEAYTFSSETLALFNRNVFDFMTIRMPRYRGGAHFTWQILKQDKVGGWFIQMVNEEMIPGVYDSGEIVKSHEYDIPATARIPADYFKLADEEGLKLFRAFIDDIIAGKDFELSRLSEDIASYFPRLYTLRHGYINWNWPGEEIERFICAFDEPYAGASTFCNGKRVFLKSCKLSKEDGGFHPFMNGLVYRIHDGKVFIAVNNGTIIAGKITNEKGEIIQDLKTGFRFYTPAEYLEQAMLFNAEYDSKGLK